MLQCYSTDYRPCVYNNRIELNVKCYAHEAHETERDTKTKRDREKQIEIKGILKVAKGKKRRRRTLNLNDSETILN